MADDVDNLEVINHYDARYQASLCSALDLDGTFSSLSQANNDTLSHVPDVLDVGDDEERKLLIS